MAMGISQRQLGVLAGIDAFAASSRVNQYEQGKHAPDFGTAARLASVLGVPVPYLFSASDELASVIRLFGSLSEEKRNWLINNLNSLNTE
jgi:transcriptional regulator with XRE-family HTH domain